MSDFVTKATTTSGPAPDPAKHVNFTYGMVLGVDDFNQEFAYLSGRDQWLARDGLGYGTVRGLQVVVEEDGANGPRVSVRPGAALSPQGQLICVTPEQCASLNAWLARQDPAALAPFIAGTAPNESVALYVALCYRQCPTDNVPIPGEPCRSEDDAMAASRLQDDFRLDLRLQPPDQAEEDGLVAFVHWLRQVPLDPGSTTAPGDFLAALRAALQVSAIATPPGFIFADPDPGLAIPADQATSYWRAAFRIWTTELRPQQIGQGKFVAFVRKALHDKASTEPNPTSVEDFRAALRSAAHLADSSVQPGYLDNRPLAAIRLPATSADQEPYWQAAFEVWRAEVSPRWISKGGQCATAADEECLLLAELTVPLTADRRVNGGPEAVVVDETDRPFVLHLRMLQEWALTDVHTAGDGEPITLAGDVSGPLEATQIDRLQGKTVSAATPGDQQVLTFDEATDSWLPAALPEVGVPDVTLAGDVSGPAAATQIDRLQGKTVSAATPGDQQVLTFDEATDSWLPAALPEVGVPDVTLAGDVSGPAAATQIDRLQGKAVNAAAPGDQQVLTFDTETDSWIPARVPVVDPPVVVLDGDVAGPAGANTIARLQSVPVASAPPAPVRDSQVLMVVNGQWQRAELPEPTQQGADVVIHEKGLPTYAIAAAGLVLGDGTRIGPVYNGLTCEALDFGLIRFSFGAPDSPMGYKLPDESFQYVVKVLPGTMDGRIPQVAFRRYDEQGIELGVLVNNQQIPVSDLNKIEFMVEISYFEKVFG